MANFYSLLFSCFLLVVLVFTTLFGFSNATDHQRQLYIVYMGGLPRGSSYSPSSHHASLLEEVVDPSFVRHSLVQSYTKSFNGFSAYLTEQEKRKIASYEGVVSVFPSRTLYPQTTRSWDFMGFSEAIQQNQTAKSDIIIGVIDTGIWPESDSFSDKGFGPVPAKWKGKCNGGANFTCNKKIIGARSYNTFGIGDPDARDTLGHGTHTASIAAGNSIKGTSFYGIAPGIARGGLPSARIAVYKVCNAQGCGSNDILAAFDDAISDGVDILSVSLGGKEPAEFHFDSIAIGSFHAMERGILTANSAGNGGDDHKPTISNAPWMMSVAASTIDRQVINQVVLGNGKTLVGNSINTFNLSGGAFPLVYGRSAKGKCDEASARNCEASCLDRNFVKGKILLCDTTDGLKNAHAAGALAAIIPSNRTDVSFVVPFPAAILTNQNFEIVREYINSTKTPVANISTSKAMRNPYAPSVPSFSSRGPNAILPDILKPDITAPGSSILAAYSPKASPTTDPLDKRSVNYTFISGTSMSCPHVAGAAAYIKSIYPDWSPSSIKSALMTTAWQMNSTSNPDAEFAYGSGHIDPVKAANPGLIYETPTEEYLQMLCSLGYIPPFLKDIYGRRVTCPKELNFTPKDLNYPSMAFHVGDNSTSFKVEFPRTVTNVGNPISTYRATISKNPKLNITVVPDTLTFNAMKEKKSFNVTVLGKLDSSSIESASLLWSDGQHKVRSPIVVYKSK